MKIIHAMLVVVLLIGVASAMSDPNENYLHKTNATTDPEMLSYAQGVLDQASIGGDTQFAFNSTNGVFVVANTFSSYSTPTLSNMGFTIFEIASAVEKIKARYPDTIKYVHININDATGENKGTALL